MTAFSLLAFSLASEAHAGWTCYTVDGNASMSVSGPQSAGVWAPVPLVFYSRTTSDVASGPWVFRWGRGTFQASDLYTGYYSNVYQPLNHGDVPPNMGAGTPFGATYFVPYVDNHGYLYGATTDPYFNWTFLPIDQSNKFFYPTSIVFGSKLYVFYSQVDYGGLWAASSTDGSTWTYTRVDGTGGQSGRLVRQPTAVIYNGVLRLYYRDATNLDLREATTTDGVSWTLSTIDGAGGSNGRILGDVGEYPSAVATPSGLFVFHYDEGNSALRYALFNGSAWTSFGVVDGGFSNSQAHGQLAGQLSTWGGSPVQYQNVPHVYYTMYNSTGDALLREATWNGNSFNGLTLDFASSGNACGSSSSSSGTLSSPKSVIMSTGTPRIYYGALGGTLRMAQYTP